MKKLLIIILLFVLLPFISSAQTPNLPQNFLFDESDIIVTAPSDDSASKPTYTSEDHAAAVNAARAILKKKPFEIRSQNFPKLELPTSSIKDTSSLREAPFGLLWGSSITDTRNQGVILSSAEIKDYPDSFLATRLPKPLSFFEKVYTIYGKEDELYRILAYSRFIDDTPSAGESLKMYNLYSDLLNKKYGNKQEFYTPATITKTITNALGRKETIEEKASIGNPEFLSQLESGSAVLYSTFYNKNVAATLSISVDGNKKSYIVIDYRNLQILQKQESQTLDAL